MPKIRKLKRRKRFRANVNRKRLRNKLRKLPTIDCKEIKEAWSDKASTARNLLQMGLAYDPNKVLEIPNAKKNMLQTVTQNKDDGESDLVTTKKKTKKIVPRKAHVAEALEKEAKWPRAKLFRLPNNEVQFATYMMDKYGDDYKAMERDQRNYYQLTSCKIKQKIERFKSIPEQYAKYLVEKGEIVLDDPTPLKEIKPQDILKEPVKHNPNSKKSRRNKKKSNVLEVVRREEDNDDVDFDTSKTLNDDVEVLESKGDGFNREKKIKLFSDDESEVDEDMQDVSDGESIDDGDSDKNKDAEMDEEDDSNSENKNNEVKITKNISKSKRRKSNSSPAKSGVKKISVGKSQKLVGKRETKLISRKSSKAKQKSKKLKLG